MDAGKAPSSPRQPPVPRTGELTAGKIQKRQPSQVMDEDYFASLLSQDELEALHRENNVVIWTKDYLQTAQSQIELQVSRQPRVRQRFQSGLANDSSQRESPSCSSNQRRTLIGVHRCPECCAWNDKSAFSSRLRGTACHICGSFDRLEAKDCQGLSHAIFANAGEDAKGAASTRKRFFGKMMLLGLLSVGLAAIACVCVFQNSLRCDCSRSGAISIPTILRFLKLPFIRKSAPEEPRQGVIGRLKHCLGEFARAWKNQQGEFARK